MYFSTVGGHFLKAQMLNDYEKSRCERYKGTIARRHVHSLASINKSIKDAQDTLRHIRASSGYCKEMQKPVVGFQPNALQVLGGKKQILQRKTERMDTNSTQVRGKKQETADSQQDLKKENVDSGDHRAVSTREPGVSTMHRDEHSIQLSNMESEQNIPNKSESSLLGKKALNSDGAGKVLGDEKEWDCKLNEDRDYKAAGRLLRDDKLMQPGRRNLNKVIKGTNKTSLDSKVNKTNSDVKESPATQIESKITRSPSVHLAGKTFSKGSEDCTIQNKEIQRPGARTYKSIVPSPVPQGTLTDERQNKRISATMTCNLDKSGCNSRTSESVTCRSQTAPKNASRSKSQVKSAPVTQRRLDFTDKSFRAKNMSTGDLWKYKIHISISRTEKKRILQELISNSAVPFDRSILEREKQRLLQDKISRFFELLFEQADNDRNFDESDMFFDD